MLKYLKGSSLLNNFIITLLGSGASKFILVGTTLVCSHLLTKDEFGAFSFIRNTLNLILTVCALNYISLCTKFTTESQYQRDSFYKLIILFLFSLLICFIIGFFLLCIPNCLYARIFDSESLLEIIYAFRLIGLLLPFFMLQPLIEGFLRGISKFNLIGILQIISSVFFLVIIWIGISYNGINGAIYGVLLYYTVYSAMSMLFLVKLNFKITFADIRKSWKYKKVLYLVVLPVFFTSFVEAPIFWISQVIITNVGSISEIGSINAILQIRNLLMLIPSYLFSTLLTSATDANIRKDYKTYFKWFNKCSLWLLIGGSIIMMFVSFFSKFIMSLYGQNYVTDGKYLIIALLAMPCWLLTSLWRVHMIIRERQRSLLIISISWNLFFLIVLLICLKYSASGIFAFFIAQFCGICLNFVVLFIYYLRDQKALLSI